MGKLIAFVAQPLRALLDLVALRKQQWAGIEWLTHGMRIDEDMLLGLRRKDFAKLKPVYKHKAVNSFLAALESTVMARKRSEEHTSELQSLMRISYAVFCLKKKNNSAKRLQLI